MWSFPAHGLGPHSAADVQVFQIFQVSSPLHQSLSGMERYSECMLASASRITIFIMYRYIIIVATFLVLLYKTNYIIPQRCVSTLVGFWKSFQNFPE